MSFSRVLMIWEMRFN